MKTLLRRTALLAALACLHAAPARALDSLAGPAGTESFEYVTTLQGRRLGSLDLDLDRSREAMTPDTRLGTLDGAGDLEVSAGGDIQNGTHNPAGSDPGTLPAGGGLVLGGGIVTSGASAGSASVLLVPEPGTGLLLAAGLALLVACRRLAPHAAD